MHTSSLKGIYTLLLITCDCQCVTMVIKMKRGSVPGTYNLMHSHFVSEQALVTDALVYIFYIQLEPAVV